MLSSASPSRLLLALAALPVAVSAIQPAATTGPMFVVDETFEGGFPGDFSLLTVGADANAFIDPDYTLFVGQSGPILSIPLAPRSQAGETGALRLTGNDSGETGGPAALNLVVPGAAGYDVVTMTFDLWMQRPASLDSSREAFLVGGFHSGDGVISSGASTETPGFVNAFFNENAFDSLNPEYRYSEALAPGPVTRLDGWPNWFGIDARQGTDSAWQSFLPAPPYGTSGVMHGGWTEVTYERHGRMVYASIKPNGGTESEVASWEIRDPNLTAGLPFVGYDEPDDGSPIYPGDVFALIDNFRLEAYQQACPEIDPTIPVSESIGDGDGYFEPGELAAFYLTLNNRSIDWPLSAGTARLTSSDPNVSINGSDTSTVPAIDPQSSAQLDSFFEIFISPDAECTTVGLTLEYETDRQRCAIELELELGQPLTESVLFSEGFEGGLGLFDAVNNSGNVDYGPPRLVDSGDSCITNIASGLSAVNNGSQAVAFNNPPLALNEPCLYGGVADDRSITLIEPIFVDGAYERLAIKWWEVNETEETYDFRYVDVSRDGTLWTTVFLDDTNTLDWTQQVAYFNQPVINENIYIRFRQASSDSCCSFTGWYVDDIEVVALSGGCDFVMQTPTATPTPFPTLTTDAFMYSYVDSGEVSPGQQFTIAFYADASPSGALIGSASFLVQFENTDLQFISAAQGDLGLVNTNLFSQFQGLSLYGVDVASDPLGSGISQGVVAFMTFEVLSDATLPTDVDFFEGEGNPLFDIDGLDIFTNVDSSGTFGIGTNPTPTFTSTPTPTPCPTGLPYTPTPTAVPTTTPTPTVTPTPTGPSVVNVTITTPSITIDISNNPPIPTDNVFVAHWRKNLNDPDAQWMLQPQVPLPDGTTPQVVIPWTPPANQLTGVRAQLWSPVDGYFGAVVEEQFSSFSNFILPAIEKLYVDENTNEVVVDFIDPPTVPAAVGFWYRPIVVDEDGAAPRPVEETSGWTYTGLREVPLGTRELRFPFPAPSDQYEIAAQIRENKRWVGPYAFSFVPYGLSVIPKPSDIWLPRGTGYATLRFSPVGNVPVMAGLYTRELDPIFCEALCDWTFIGWVDYEQMQRGVNIPWFPANPFDDTIRYQAAMRLYYEGDSYTGFVSDFLIMNEDCEPNIDVTLMEQGTAARPTALPVYEEQPLPTDNTIERESPRQRTLPYLP